MFNKISLGLPMQKNRTTKEAKRIFVEEKLSFILCYLVIAVFSKNSSAFSLIAFYLLLSAALCLLNACVDYQVFFTYENPDGIDFATLWYHEVPVPQLIVTPMVS
jgi:phosphoglycerol transferase MdoB-like AlkP superfamily enzyme